VTRRGHGAVPVEPISAGRPTPRDLARLPLILKAADAVIKEIDDAGALVFDRRLGPASTASVVRLQDGGDIVTDGPFAPGNEHAGGVWVIEAPDLEAALEWGRKTARALTLPVEVRPFQE
jgi:hypothetical protein